MSNIRESYKQEKDAVKEAYTRQMGLRENKEYEQWADETAVDIIKEFINQYPDVKIEIPKLRVKSPKSLLGKIKNLQIERLSKIYTVAGALSREDKVSLYKLLEERIYESEELDTEKVLKEITNIIYGDIKPEDIQRIEKTIMVDGISKSTKTALLRILTMKMLNGGNFSIEEMKTTMWDIESKYGSVAAQRSGNAEDDILGYASIRKIRRDKETIERLSDDAKFLKANDLRGMKIVVVDVPEDFKTDNEEIKRILEKRKNIKSEGERAKYTHQIIVEIGKDFFKKIEQNKEFLEKNHMQVIRGSNKHKKKANGYEAEHIKFINTEHPEFTLETQFKSEYVENICKGEGKASHENRPGKARILPECKNNKEMVQKLKYMVPEYETFNIQKDKNILIQKQPMVRNVMCYFQEQIDVESKEYERILNALESEQERIS